MRYREQACRSQGYLFTNLEDLISENNPVRLLDLLVDKLYESDPDRFTASRSTRNDHVGRKAYSPMSLTKLYLYGCLNQIPSSRRLERECHRNVEVMWLLHTEHPDHKTISNFRKDNAELIAWCTRSFRKFLRDEKYLSGKTVAYDGCKLKANAAKSGYTLQGIGKRLLYLDQLISDYLVQLDSTDINEDGEELIESSLMDRIASLEEEVLKLQTYKELMEEGGRENYFPNDPQSILVKGRYGSYPGYNVQAGIDSKNHMVTSAYATTSANDWNQLEDNVKSTKESLGENPEIVIADCGYANIESIETIESDDVTKCVVPLQESERQKKDRKYKLKFVYNKEKDVVICPRGKELTLKDANYKNRHENYFRWYQAKKSVCLDCPKKDICLNTKNGRTYYISHNEYLEDYKKRSQSKEFRKISKKRKGLIEHLFGTFQMWMGKIPLLLRGRKKVQIQIDLYATAYNIRRLLNIEPMEVLLKKLQNYTFATV